MERRSLPSVDRLARTVGAGLPPALAVQVARSTIERARELIDSGQPADAERLASEASRHLRRMRPMEVINATGVLLHTNLGRAPLDPGAATAARLAALAYGNLEMDLSTGNRGGRGSYLRELILSVTGGEAALVVNNNAGALFLTLIALAPGRSVPVSRGELIEIGGSYRLPELMAASGARLVEVGTTNRTRLDDYRRAIDETTALLLKVHPSNYRIAGFAEDTPLTALHGLATDTALPLAYDIGSGLLDESVPWLAGPPPAWLAGEPGVAQSLRGGAGLVMFSGDKLLGGPQAGIVVGAGELVARLSRHPVARALRIDGPSLAALTVTFERYADGTAAELPFWRMATATYPELEERCTALITASGIEARVVAGSSTVGAGSVPGSEVPTPLVVIEGATEDRYLALLAADPPVVTRREAGAIVIDLRSVPPGSDDELAKAVAAVCPS